MTNKETKLVRMLLVLLATAAIVDTLFTAIAKPNLSISGHCVTNLCCAVLAIQMLSTMKGQATKLEMSDWPKKLWMRMGVVMMLSDEDEKAIFSSDEEAIYQAILKVIDEGRYLVDGEAYIPETAVHDFNAEYGTEYEAHDIEVSI